MGGPSPFPSEAKLEYAAHLQLLCGQMLRNLSPCVYRPQVLEELFQLSVRATPADRGMYPGLLAGLAPSSKQAVASTKDRRLPFPILPP